MDQELAGTPNTVQSVWGGSITCHPEFFFEPETTHELKEIVKAAGAASKKVRVIGCGHSTCHIAMTTDYMISLAKFNRVLHVDKDKGQLKVEAGIQMRTLNRDILPDLGLAFSTQPTVDDITVGGVISVGAQGPGDNFQIVSAQCVAFEVMTASGDVMTISEAENPDLLPAIRVALGSLGIILNVTIQFEPAFNLKEETHSAGFEEAMNDFDSGLSGSAEHYSYCWLPHTGAGVVTLFNRTKQEVTFNKSSVFWGFVGGTLYNILLWLCTFVPMFFPPVQKLYHQVLFKHPSQRIDRSDKVFTAYDPNSYTVDLTVPRSQGAKALRDVRRWCLSDAGIPYPYMVILLTTKKDNIYLSQAYERDVATILVIVMRPFDIQLPVEKYFKDFQEVLSSYGARPHWPVDNNLTAEQLEKVFPKWDTFHEIRKRLDPEGMFMNDFLVRKFEK